MAVPDDRIDEVLAGLADRYQAPEYRLSLAPDVSTSFETTIGDFAMTCWFDTKKRDELHAESGRAPYIAHVLDGPTLGAAMTGKASI